MYVALDIGGTNIRAAFSVGISGMPQTVKRHVNVPITNAYDTDLRNILHAVKTISAGRHRQLAGVGVGLPAIMADDGKTIAVGPNLSGWVGHQLGADLESSLGCRVLIENDDTTAACGEAKFGYGIGRNFVYVTWGTGLGGAKVDHVEGHLVVRQFEVGHHILEWSADRVCGCGQMGCAEAYAGGGSILRYYGRPANELKASEWDEVLERLAQALVNTLMFNPTDLIIFGGGIAVNQKDKIELLREKIARRLIVYPLPELIVTKYGDDLGLYGAFSLLDERTKY